MAFMGTPCEGRRWDGCDATTHWRSALLFGIREGRCRNQVAGVGTLEAGEVTFTNTGVHGAVRRARLVCKAAEIRLDEVFLEALARVPGDNFLSQLRRELVEPSSEHIETDARIEERDFRAHVLSDAGRGVQGNGLPDRLHLLFRDVMCGKELTGGIGAIDLEAFVLARELLDETEIVKCRGDVEEFGVEAELLLTALLSREQIDADGVVKEQIGRILTQDLCRLFREQGIGNHEGGSSTRSHGSSPLS